MPNFSEREVNIVSLIKDVRRSRYTFIELSMYEALAPWWR